MPIELPLIGSVNERVRLLFHLSNNSGYQDFSKTMGNRLKFVSASTEGTVFEFTVEEMYADTTGNLHAGAAALILDMCTSVALIPVMTNSWQHLGLSRNLNLSFIHPAPVGTTVLITSTVAHLEDKLANIKGVMTFKSNGRLVCMAEHLKFNSRPTEKL